MFLTSLVRLTATTFGTVLILTAPAAAFAAAPGNTLQGFLETMTNIVILATPFAAALLYFFWNLAVLLFTLDDAEKKKQARARMIFGIIALFVLFTVAGLVAVLQRSIFGSTTGTGGNAPVTQPAANPLQGGSGNSGNSGNQTQPPPLVNPFTTPI